MKKIAIIPEAESNLTQYRALLKLDRKNVFFCVPSLNLSLNIFSEFTRVKFSEVQWYSVKFSESLVKVQLYLFLTLFDRSHIDRFYCYCTEVDNLPLLQETRFDKNYWIIFYLTFNGYFNYSMRINYISSTFADIIKEDTEDSFHHTSTDINHQRIYQNNNVLSFPLSSHRINIIYFAWSYHITCQ